MGSTINIHLRGFGDFYSLRAWKYDDKIQHAGTIYTIAQRVYTLLETGDLTDFAKKFRRYRYAGTRYVAVPGARTPADPSYLTGHSASEYESAAYDLNVFQSYRRWRNDVGTTPDVEPTSGSWNGDMYFLTDPYWKKCSMFAPWKKFCRPLSYSENRSYPYYTEDSSVVNVGGELNGSDLDGSVASDAASESLSDASVEELNAGSNTAPPWKKWYDAPRPHRADFWRDVRLWNVTGAQNFPQFPSFPDLLYRVPRTIRTSFTVRLWTDSYIQFASPICHPVWGSSMHEMKDDLCSRLEDLDKEVEKKAEEVPGLGETSGCFPFVRANIVEKPEDVPGFRCIL